MSGGMMEPTADLSSEQCRALSEAAAKYGLRMILLFGSALTGRTHAGSDLDLAVRFEGEPPDLRSYALLCSDLQSVFPDQPVDVAALNRADPLFLKKITESCQLLYGNLRELQELKIYAFKRYQDHRPYFDMERAYAGRFINPVLPKP